MVARVSTLSQFLFAQETIGTQLQTRQVLNQRLSTGRQHPTLSAYRQDLPRLVGLQTENALLSRQQASLDVTRTFLDAYSETLIGTTPLGTSEGAATGLTGLAELVLAELTDLYSAVNDTEPNESFNDVQTRKQASVDDLLRSVTSLLNKRVGDRYLFSGYRYRTAPVQDLSQSLVTAAAGGVANLALLDTADLDENFEADLKAIDPDAIATGELAEYDSEFDPADPLATNEDAVGAHRINLASDSVFSYGVHANEAFVQDFVQTLRLYRSVVEADVFDPRDGVAFVPGGGQADLEDADTLEGFTAVLDGLRDRLRDSIEAFQTRTEAHLTLEIRLTQRRSELRSTLQTNQSQIDAIQSTDPNTVAVELSALNLQLQASFQAITTARNLSLVNFL